MPALNINDLNNAKKDLDHIADVATSESMTAQDRFGRIKSTLLGAIYSLKAFNMRGVFIAGSAYAMKDVYVSDGIAYVATQNHVASTVVADLAAGKVAVHQGATREDLSSSFGSLLIGWIRSGFGATARTVDDKLQEMSASVADHGGKGDGITNDTAAFTKARAATGGAYHIPNGSWVIDPPFNPFEDEFTAGDNVTLIIGGTSYNVSRAFCGALRYRTDSYQLTSIVHAKTGNILMQFQDGTPGTATYFKRTIAVETDSHWMQVQPASVGGSTDLLWQRSRAHPTDPAGNRFNETFEEGPDRLLYSFATTASGAPNFDTYMAIYAGVTPRLEFPALAPCFRQGWTMQNRAENGYKMAWVVGADRHYIKNAAETFTHMTFTSIGGIGFFGAGGTTRPTITGSRGGNAALASLLLALSNFGLIADNTTA